MGWGSSRQYTGRDNLEQFRMTKRSAWASVNNSYSLLQARKKRDKNHSYNEGCEDNLEKICTLLNVCFLLYINIFKYYQPALATGTMNHTLYTALASLTILVRFSQSSVYIVYINYAFMRYMYIYIFTVYVFICEKLPLINGAELFGCQ